MIQIAIDRPFFKPLATFFCTPRPGNAGEWTSHGQNPWSPRCGKFQPCLFSYLKTVKPNILIHFCMVFVWFDSYFSPFWCFFVGVFFLPRLVDLVRKVAWWRVELQSPKEMMNGKFPRHCESDPCESIYTLYTYTMYVCYIYIYMHVYLYIYTIYNFKRDISMKFPNLVLLEFVYYYNRYLLRLPCSLCVFNGRVNVFFFVVLLYYVSGQDECISTTAHPFFLEAIRKQAVEQLLQDVPTSDWLHDGTWTRVW